MYTHTCNLKSVFTSVAAQCKLVNFYYIVGDA